MVHFLEGFCITPNLSSGLLGRMPFVQNIQVVCDNHVVADYDYVDLVEYNWLRTKMANPRPGVSWLVPFNREGVGVSRPERVCAVCVNKIKDLHLLLHFNSCCSGIPLELGITLFGVNIMTSEYGMVGIKYLHGAIELKKREVSCHIQLGSLPPSLFK